MRHSGEWRVVRQGIHPKIVAEMLGHSTVSMTLDIYSHVIPDMQRGATTALDRLLSGADAAGGLPMEEQKPLGVTDRTAREGEQLRKRRRQEGRVTTPGKADARDPNARIARIGRIAG